MEYNSFYGGRRGASFIIAGIYETIPQMTEDFKKGADCKVNYEEYVKIETSNKNNPDNGKVFKRGFDFGNETDKIEYHEVITT